MKLTTAIWVLTLLFPVGAVFSDSDFYLINALCEFYSISSVVFVDGQDGIIENIKRSSQYNKLSVYVNMEQLENILMSDESNFIWTKTMITIHSKIEIGSLLRMIKNPKLVIWVLYTDPLDILPGEGVPYNGEVLRVDTEEDRLKVTRLLRPRGRGMFVEVELGYVVPQSNLMHFPQKNDYMNHIMDMSNVDMKIGVSDDPCRRRKDGIMLGKIFCFHSAILDIMAERLKFEYTTVVHEGEEFSFVSPNGSYSGFFQMLLQKKVNLSVAAFVISPKRMDDFLFIWPTFTFQTMMYVKKAEAVGSSLNASPFSASIWVITSIWIVLAGGILCISELYSHKVKASSFISMCHAVLKIFHLICNQGSSCISSSASSRIVFFTAIFGGMMLSYYYSAVVLSYLTLEHVELPFNDFQGFLTNGKYKITGVADGFITYFLKYEMAQMRHQTRKYLVRTEELPSGIQEGIDQLCSRKRLTLLELKGALLSLDRSECELMEVPVPVFYEYFGFAAMKDFQFGEHFTLMLSRLYEFGVMKKMKQNVSRYANLKALHEDSDFITVTLEQIINLYSILNIGILLSIIILLLEILINKRNKRNKINFASSMKIVNKNILN